MPDYSTKHAYELLAYLKSKFERLKAMSRGLPDSQSTTAKYVEHECTEGAAIVNALREQLSTEE